MKRFCRLVLLTSTMLMLSFPAVSQQAVAPPPKPADEGPTLDVTMKFIQDKLNDIGPLNYVSYLYPSNGGSRMLFPYQFETIKVVADLAACRIEYRETFGSGGKPLLNHDWSLLLKNVTNIVVKSDEQLMNEADARSKDPNGTYRDVPPVFVLTVHRTDKVVNEFYFFDEQMANRVAKAMVHAVELCGGGSQPEPF